MRSFLDRLFGQRVVPTVAEAERAYLNASVSRFDLERRQREIDLGLFRNRSFGVLG
ncbi:DUF3563 family protein [Tabrizicola sp.]|jgi:Protein of unknown function (DUF3563)|uniref:DUF3563 family protein n=1 Tax=Tabrizicola sp. TaxID=2005166 RepID=UPI00286CE30C|nr:DUF3563 family protein [Tabrizicola sp.]